MEKVTLKIQGMDCASCAAVIEHDLKKQKGISSDPYESIPYIEKAN